MKISGKLIFLKEERFYSGSMVIFWGTITMRSCNEGEGLKSTPGEMFSDARQHKSKKLLAISY
jgi:hypothetical protein